MLWAYASMRVMGACVLSAALVYLLASVLSLLGFSPVCVCISVLSVSVPVSVSASVPKALVRQIPLNSTALPCSANSDPPLPSPAPYHRVSYLLLKTAGRMVAKQFEPFWGCLLRCAVRLHGVSVVADVTNRECRKGGDSWRLASGWVMGIKVSSTSDGKV